MRQDVPIRSRSSNFARCLSISSVWLLCVGMVGCQLTPPPARTANHQLGSRFSAEPSPSDGAVGRGANGSNATYKPADESASAAPITPASQASGPPVLSAGAQIRGQSGSGDYYNGWNSGTAGGSDSYRQPMVATEANRYVQPGYPVATTPSQLPQTAGTLPPPPGTAAPNTVLQPPVGQIPSAQPYGYGAPSATVTPPPQGYGVPGTYATPDPGYGYAAPNSYGSTLAPGVAGPLLDGNSSIAPGVFPGYDPLDVGGYQPRERITPLDVYAQEARTGRVIVGGSVNSDLGVAGQIVIEERNFDFRRVPRNWNDLWSGEAFRGDGQNLRVELMPGNQVERYTANWSTRNLFGYLPYSLSVGGFYYTRQFRDWTEQRLGGRVALGREVTKDLSISTELRMEDVKLFDPRLSGVSELDDALGSNDLYTARFRVARDTRDSPFMSTEGSLLELVYDQVFGEYDYPRGQVNYSRYFQVRERPGGGGRHILASTFRVGISGAQTPIFENYFAGGYSTLRGFSFRGASPKVGDIQVGGELMLLGSLEYVFPLTADEMLRGVAFVDYGTVERDLKINSEDFRVAPGLGLRVTVPALGPAPLAFDFAYPINHADSDDRQIFSFNMGFTR